jgi:WD40 repeat protein
MYTLSGSNDGILTLWDIKTGEIIRTFKGHHASVVSVSYSYDGKYAISGSYDGEIKIWNIEKGN